MRIEKYQTDFLQQSKIDSMLKFTNIMIVRIVNRMGAILLWEMGDGERFTNSKPDDPIIKPTNSGGSDP